MKSIAILFVTFLGASTHAENSFVTEMKLPALEIALSSAMNADSVSIRSLDKKPSPFMIWSFDRREIAQFAIVFTAKLKDKQFELSCTLHDNTSADRRPYAAWIEIPDTECTITSDGKFAFVGQLEQAGFSVNVIREIYPRFILIPMGSLVLIERQYENEHPRHGLL